MPEAVLHPAPVSTRTRRWDPRKAARSARLPMCRSSLSRPRGPVQSPSAGALEDGEPEADPTEPQDEGRAEVDDLHPAGGGEPDVEQPQGELTIHGDRERAGPPRGSSRAPLPRGEGARGQIRTEPQQKSAHGDRQERVSAPQALEEMG